MRCSRISLTNDHGAYDVFNGKVRVGRVVTDETRVWHAFDQDGRLVSAAGTRRQALRELAEAVVS